MKITSKTTVKFRIDTAEDMIIWQSLFGKLHGYVTPVKEDLYKSSSVGYLKQIVLTANEINLINFVHGQINEVDK